MTSTSVTAASAATTASPLPLDAAPFLVAEVGGSTQTSYDLYALTNAFISGQITPRSLIYRPDLTGQQWLPIASSHPHITAALAIPYLPPPSNVAGAAAQAATPSSSAASAIAWYYVDSQTQRMGPLTLEALQALHRGGTLTDSTLLWHDGLTNWMTLTEAIAQTESDAYSSPQQHQHHDDNKDGSEGQDEHKQQQHTTTATTTTTTAVNNKRKQALTFFGKAGVIREDVRSQGKRVKLYREEGGSGVGKGDATVNYMFRESVELALTLLDGAEIRPGYPVSVTEAKFDHAATARTAAAAAGGQQGGVGRVDMKRSKVDTILAKRQKEVALSWQGDDSSFYSSLPATTSSSSSTALGLRIVVLSRLFTPAEAAEASVDTDGDTDAFFEELTSDIGEELEARCGVIDKMTVYERSEEGVVVVKFKSVEGAERCVREMRGRKFGGREIGVEWWDGRDYSVRETVEEENERLARFAAALESEET